ncbi:quinone oxidoreductase family protein [Ilumatobacter nonamiensis]|uniref:quinone oxidoreductase family protein n=1 Tax=Ilumatobacter nonamiensis TaxID=467093 RepID=UPI00034521D1|nr:zinc-binding dehydrogenase [Ilumatobacter nonamiensis]
MTETSRDEETVTEIVVDAPGDAEVLQIRTRAADELASGSVRVKITAIAVNFRDIHVRRGTGDIDRYPVVPGSDYAGIVTEVADDVTDVAIGQRVVGLAATGAYATEIVTPRLMVHPLPATISDELAATLPTAGMTASFLCSSSGVGSGSTVITWAAAGGLGCYLGAVAADLGATTIGITSTDDKADAARNAGHRHVVTYRTGHPVELVREFAPAGVDIVFDAVGGPDFARSFRMLADHGTVVLCGRAAGEPDIGNLAADFIGSRRNLALRDFSLMGHLVTNLDQIPGRFDQLIATVTRHPDLIPITTYPLCDAADAHRHIETGASIGKIVLLP